MKLYKAQLNSPGVIFQMFGDTTVPALERSAKSWLFGTGDLEFFRGVNKSLSKIKLRRVQSKLTFFILEKEERQSTIKSQKEKTV